MNIEVKAQDVIDYLLLQNRQLTAEIAVLRAAMGLTGEHGDRSLQDESH